MFIFDVIFGYILPFLFLITVLVFVHEYGHYWVARKCGVRVETFSIGFGTEIFGWNDKHGTRWRVSYIPLGGYVKMFGDADPASRPDHDKTRQMTAEEKEVSFFHQSLWKRSAIIVAGPLANFIFAVFAFIALLSVAGHPLPPAIVGQVLEESAAEAAGILPGDEILTVEGQTMYRFVNMMPITRKSEGKPLAVEVYRNGETLNLSITPKMTHLFDEDGELLYREDGSAVEVPILGLRPDFQPRPFNEAFTGAFKETYQLSVFMLKGVWEIITGARGVDELSGPVGIAQMSGEYYQQSGWAPFFFFMALISINLGLVNLFPIPMLDGGHLAMYSVEAVTGKPLKPRVQEYFYRAGLAMVLCLVITATWNDLARILSQ